MPSRPTSRPARPGAGPCRALVLRANGLVVILLDLLARRLPERRCSRVLGAAMLGLLLGGLLPALLTAGTTTPGPGLAVLTVALAALLTLVLWQVRLVAGTGPVPALAADGPPPLLPGRATDPVHHPVRPRAPGPARRSRLREPRPVPLPRPGALPCHCSICSPMPWPRSSRRPTPA